MSTTTPITPAAKVERTPTSTPGGPRVKREKILVTVRLRPLSKKEQSLKDQVAWECVDDHTVVLKQFSHDRTNSSAQYTFDKVFGPTCPSDIVYEEGAKEVALSSLRGINGTIFAYGQTSSGKTYTMRGITERAVNDIYKHIENTPGREYIIKISAMEIYNEVVRDMLKPDSGPLRLLDDPEKGTIAEKLEEQIVKDIAHLRHLIGICEAQRQVGETSLNDASSRSHQIIRLMIESSLKESSGCVNSYMANLNLVDLAGSERASQTNVEGSRLKEGCHINLSLLTLTTVIRKLRSFFHGCLDLLDPSCEACAVVPSIQIQDSTMAKRSGHVPYRQSKLTRILQPSLGGNARTAIVCTLSPALSHVEQSRITLSFASCAKEVASDKQLVRQLQREVARLEAELRTPEHSAFSNSEVMLMEKEIQIKKMEMEMEELKRERDMAKSQLDELQRKVQRDQISSTVPSMLVHEIRKLEQLQVQLGEEANRALEVLQKEVACHRLGNQDAAETIARLQAEIKEVRAIRSLTREVDVRDVVSDPQVGANLKEEITRLHSQEVLLQILKNV
ncbi:hypothetical protein HPP92_003281 [Vanilla planifolia]|uniref:Kinesin motor domain-containing protein n=1 Tax=Vanilla planifolia TaxID=51239 RepID=A0A835RU44_VANPL|nr:hypothetical protein HPP92_003281 [Vanilla planifolia]